MKRAFTLIELIVVIAIVSLLTTITLATYVSAKNKRTVKVKAEELRNIISEARSLAISPPSTTECSAPSVLKTGVQILQQDSRVMIYFDCNGSSTVYRDYSAGFNKVHFVSDYYVVFNASSSQIGQLDLDLSSANLSSANPITLTSPDTTSAKYKITVNNFGFSDIVQ